MCTSVLFNNRVTDVQTTTKTSFYTRALRKEEKSAFIRRNIPVQGIENYTWTSVNVGPVLNQNYVGPVLNQN